MDSRSWGCLGAKLLFFVECVIVVFRLFQFESYNPQNDRIKEAEFAEILMTYASLTDKQRKKKIKKVKQRFVGDNADVRKNP